jgi:hypothetical protein
MAQFGPTSPFPTCLWDWRVRAQTEFSQTCGARFTDLVLPDLIAISIAADTFASNRSC